MNCKQGDLAIFVRVDCAWEEQDLGQLVEVIGTGDDYSGEGDGRFHWKVRAASGKLLAYRNVDGEFGYTNMVDVPDSNMRPIRDPGEDATDETLVPGYVKHKEHA